LYGRRINLTLKDFNSKPLSEIIEQMDMVDLKIHSDNNGTINSIEIKYADPSSPESKIGKR
jgi:hypothetical protein